MKAYSPLSTRFLLLLLATLTCGSQATPMNIIHIVLDDAGYADFQSTDSMMVTPNIDKLRTEGLFLNQSYVLPMCAPTRSAILTGRLPHTYGAQDGQAAGTNKLFWVNETLTMLPQAMKKLNYRTHMLGKWHLGFCHPDLTPTGRGFDTYYGLLLGSHNSYYTHFKGVNGPYDWWDGSKIDWSAQGIYSTELLSARAVRIVEESNPLQPFYMYLAYTAPHGPKEVPQHYVDSYCLHVTNYDRQIQCGMIAAVDEGIGQIVQALKDKGTYDNTAIVIMPDNGGPVTHSAVNYPLRGGKKSVYEGGTRVYTVLKAPGLAAPGTTWPGMVHAIDWMPTFVTMGGGQTESYMHGISVWDAIKNNEPSPRTEFLYTYDDYPKFQHRAYRYKQWKLIQGKPGFDLGWYPPYQLQEQGVPWEDVQKEYEPDDFEMYNIETDPNERKNLLEEPVEVETEEIFKLIKGKMQQFLEKYPIQPFVESARSEAWENLTTNEVTTCWCRPPGFSKCENNH